VRIPGSRGFTLIEVLIAMTLLGVIVVLLFGSLRIAAQSWSAGERRIEQVNQKAVVYQFFKRHLTAVRPVQAPENNDAFASETDHAFLGLPQRMRFVGALPASSARKGLQIFDIFADPQRPGALLVTLTPYRDSDELPPPEPPEVLLDGVADFKFAYFGQTEDVAERVWRDKWDAADRLPKLIKVSILLQDGSYWPDMIFALKITQAANPDEVADDDADNDENDGADADDGDE